MHNLMSPYHLVLLAFLSCVVKAEVLFFIAGVEVGFERNSYAVNEIVSSVAICVVVVGNGSLGTDLELELETQDGTAQGVFLSFAYFQPTQ